MLEFLVYQRRGYRVFFVIGVFGPAVEAPVRVGDFPGRVADGDRAGVAHPSAVGGNAKEIDGGEIGAGLFQNGADFGFSCAILHQQINALNAREMPDDFREGPGNRRELSRPVGLFVRPAEPRGVVMFPLGGHPVAEVEGAL